MRLWIAILAASLGLSVLKVSDAAISDQHLVWWVNQRVTKLEARFAQRPFDQIGWAEDLRQALLLADEHHRLAFVFTFDGIEMDTGRC